MGKAERPSIKGESDSDEDEEEETTGDVIGKHYNPKNASSALHGQLGAYDPLKPLDRGEDLPSVDAYPRYDPYSKDDAAFNAFAPTGPGDKKSKSKKNKKKEKKKGDAGADNGKEKKEKKDKKDKKEKPSGKKSKSPKDKVADAAVDNLTQSLVDATVG